MALDANSEKSAHGAWSQTQADTELTVSYSKMPYYLHTANASVVLCGALSDWEVVQEHKLQLAFKWLIEIVVRARTGTYQIAKMPYFLNWKVVWFSQALQTCSM